MENYDINLVIGQNLQKLRRNMKMTQLELAEKFNYSDKSISKWEKGESLPSVDVLYQLAKFYGVTLDALTDTAEIVPQIAHNEEKKRPFPTRLIITLLAISAVWVTATIVYACIKISLGVNYYMAFLWSVPASCIIMIVFNAIWGKKQWLFYILSVMLWTLLACLHIQLIEYNVWPIYFIGIPIQVAFILWSALVHKPEKTKKQKNIAETNTTEISANNNEK